MKRPSRLDRAAAWVAALVCLVFLAGIPSASRLWPLSSTGVLPTERLERIGQAALDVTVLAGHDGDSFAPLPGAAVRVFWADGNHYRAAGEGVTGGDGRMHFEALPRGVIWVLADASGYARASTQLVLGQDGRDIVLRLEPVTPLRVRVVDDRGAAVPGATVLVSTADPLPFGALTDADGLALFTRLGPPPYRVRVAARGYQTATRDDVVGDVTIALAPLSTLEVSVIEADEKPAARATVMIAGPMLHPARKAETNEKGVTRITGLDPGVYDLKALRGGLVSPTEIGVRLGRGEHKKLTLRLLPGRTVTARVTDGHEDPPIVIPNADVILVESGISSFPIEGRTDTFGEVSLGPLPPGPAVIGARAEGFVPKTAITVPDDLSEPVRIPLVRGATLSGIVVDELDRPIDGASIEVIGTTVDGLPISETPMHMAFRSAHFELALAGPAPLIAAGELGVMPGPIPPIPGGALSERLAEHLARAPKPWVTGYDGKFSATPIPPGRVRALVRHPEYVEAVSRPVSVGPGGEAKVRVVLVSGGSVEGRVLTESGIPVAGARVDISAVVGSLQQTTMTATDGTFAFAAIPARTMLSLARPDDPSRIVYREPLSVPAGEQVDVEVTLPDVREDVTFHISGDGQPLELAQVTLVSVDPSVPLRDTYFTDPEGIVIFEDARGLEARVLIEAPDYVPLSRTLVLEEQHEIELRLGVIVEGRVTAVRGRVEVEGAVVEYSAGARREVTITDDQGAYRFEAIAPGPARLTVSHPSYAEVQVDVRVEETGRADRPFEVEAINLEEAGRVRGRVVDRRGDPVAGARVAAGPVSAYLPLGALPPGMVQTNAKGEYELVGLDPGLLDVEAYSVEKGRGTVRDVEVVGGEVVEDVVIELSPTGAADEPGSTGNVAVTLAEQGQGDDYAIVVLDVALRSEALRAGLAAGDLLLEIDGVEPASLEDARELFGGPEGTDVVVVVDRSGQPEPLSLTIRRERVRR